MSEGRNPILYLHESTADADGNDSWTGGLYVAIHDGKPHTRRQLADANIPREVQIVTVLQAFEEDDEPWHRIGDPKNRLDGVLVTEDAKDGNYKIGRYDWASRFAPDFFDGLWRPRDELKPEDWDGGCHWYDQTHEDEPDFQPDFRCPNPPAVAGNGISGPGYVLFCEEHLRQNTWGFSLWRPVRVTVDELDEILYMDGLA